MPLILVILALVAAFLIWQGLPALTAPAEDLPYGAFPQFVAPLVFGTVWVAFLALLMGVPVADRHRAVHLPLRARAGWPPASAT